MNDQLWGKWTNLLSSLEGQIKRLAITEQNLESFDEQVLQSTSFSEYFAFRNQFFSLREETDIFIQKNREMIHRRQIKLENLNNALKTKRKKLSQLEVEISKAGQPSKKAVENVWKPPTTHQELAALRVRDAALERVGILERQLALYKEEAELPALRIMKHRHFVKRLRERFNIHLAISSIPSLEVEVAILPSWHFTHRGTPVKIISIQGKYVHTISTPDEYGDNTLTTVYTEDMLNDRLFFVTSRGMETRRGWAANFVKLVK